MAIKNRTGFSTRSTRYGIYVTRKDGTTDLVQANAVRKDAVKRARFISEDAAGWPSTDFVVVKDGIYQIQKFVRAA